jgi:hypothetical protein
MLSKFSVENKNKYINGIDLLPLAILKHNNVWLRINAVEISVENKNKYIIEGFIDRLMSSRINAVEIFCGNKNKYIIEGLSWNLNLYDHESMLSKFSVKNKNKYTIQGFIDWLIH